jgi:membrane-bound lytic murein transglycosylase D
MSAKGAEVGRPGRAGGAMFAALVVAGILGAAPFSRAAAQSAVTDSAAIDTAVVTAIVAGPVWDIDVHSYETHQRVQHFIGLFSGKVREEFEKSLQRQSRYGALIRQKLRDGGLPEDMTYLALIESWYDPNAFSKAAAVGIWQFMAGTARGVGLRVDWWADERRDPVRSTEGAVRLLSGLRAQFGSLYLAAAAYDGGDGRVSRGLVRYAGRLDGVEGEDRFFSLAETSFLRPETRDYVPKIIAAALVGKEPARYGVKIDSVPEFAFDTVRVPGGTSLAGIANAAGVPAENVHDLNLHLLRGMTPPDDSLWVRVPVGAADGFDERFAALEPEERAAGKYITTKKGESMSSVARAHGISTKQLGWYNPRADRLKNGNLVAGQRILVPTRATLHLAVDVPNPSLERYPRKAKTPAKSTTKGKVAAVTKAAAPAPVKKPAY